MKLRREKKNIFDEAMARNRRTTKARNENQKCDRLTNRRIINTYSRAGKKLLQFNQI